VRLEKKQSKIIENSANPIFNETFEFELNNLISNLNHDLNDQKKLSNDILNNHNLFISQIGSQIQLFFLIMDFDPIEKNDAIGKIELSAQFNNNFENYENLDRTNNDAHSLIEKKRSNYSSSQSNWYDIFDQPNIPVLCQYPIHDILN
jgi:hypothetical protein